MTKVRKDTPTEGFSQLTEIRAQVLLQGDFVPSFIHGDNSLVVPTDTCKNTIYFLAKDHLHDDIEAFGVVVGRHFLKEYAHVSTVKLELQQVDWQRLVVAGVPHKHSFEQQPLKRLATVVASRDSLRVTGGFSGLRLLKTTGSGFAGFHRCPLTTLPDIHDRILSTTITAVWSFCSKAVNAGTVPYSAIFDQIRTKAVDIFCNTYSISVQATMWEIGKHAIDFIPQLTDISLDLPNLHNWHYDLSRFGLENNVDSRSQIFFPTDEPHGVIRCTVSRNQFTAKL